MPIVIVCKQCRTRFKVSEKFAGRKGPCPKCKAPIYVPKPDEEVEIHTPVHSEAGARGVEGQLVLEPVSRPPMELPIWAMGAIATAVVAVFVTAYLLQPDEGEAPNVAVAVVGLLVLTPALIVAGYSFLRDDELEPYRGQWLWIRTAICSGFYLGLWGAYAAAPATWTDDLWKWAFIGPLLAGAGTTVVFSCLDLDVASGFFHFVFYFGTTMLLAWLMGFAIY